MAKLIEIGSQFGRWIVLEHQGSDHRGMSQWLCQCACGRRVGVLGQNLRSGMSRQCRACAHHQPHLTHAQLHTLRTLKATRPGGIAKHGTYSKYARLFEVTPNNIKLIWRSL